MRRSLQVVLNVRRIIRTIAATSSILALSLAVLPANATVKRTVAQKKQAAKTQYERAEQLREELHGTPKDERSADEYQQVIDAFRKVYYTAPTSSKADESVLAIGFIPDRDDLDAIGEEELAGAELRLGLMGETVADAEGEFFEGQHKGPRR